MRKRGAVCRSLAIAGLALAVVPALGGCAKRQIYAGDRKPDDQVAYLVAERYLLAGVEFEVDGRPVGSLAQYHLPPGVGGGFLGSPRIGASVLPGMHRLTVRVANYGWASAADTACGSMTFPSEAGQTYRLTIDRNVLFMMQAEGGAILAQAPLGACPVTAER
jgi:hypothetical protein